MENKKEQLVSQNMTSCVMAAVVMEDLLLLISLLAEATEGIQRQSKDQIEG